MSCESQNDSVAPDHLANLMPTAIEDMLKHLNKLANAATKDTGICNACEVQFALETSIQVMANLYGILDEMVEGDVELFSEMVPHVIQSIAAASRNGNVENVEITAFDGGSVH